ncbi:MAG: hypothetical protein ABI811_09830 [Acidobacteriota bacterium]
MNFKFGIYVAAAALSMAVIAAAKSYEVDFAKPVQAGGAQLAAGEYKVKLEGATAVFTPANSNKSLTVPVKLESVAKKYSETTTDTVQRGGDVRLRSIELGGSTTKLEFEQ